MLRIATIGNRFVLTCMVVGTMVVGSASAVFAAPVSSDDELEHMGLVEAMPDGGGAGTWIIGGETFTADEDTEFETDEGTLEVGACAEVEYEADADGNLALEIEGEDSPDCVDDEEDDDADDDAHDDEMDEDDADENEADDSEDADATEGDADGSGTSESGAGSAADAGGTGSAEVRLMNNVSGANQNQDPPDTGSTEVEDPNDSEEDEADESEEDEADEDDADEDEMDEDDADEDEEEDENEVFGTIETMPAGSDAPLGTWVINGVSYVATADTEIEEEYGPLEVGANVELEFEIVDGVNQLTELETEPAPGEAPNTTEGVINSKGGVVVAATVSGTTAADATWVIGNTEYTVLGITAQEGALVIGSMAQVNSYTHADGREIATLIRNVETQNFMYLPIVLQHG